MWQAARTALSALPMWLIAGWSWWPAFLLFPVVGAVAVVVMRPYLGEIARRKVIEEAAWTDHAAGLVPTPGRVPGLFLGFASTRFARP